MLSLLRKTTSLSGLPQLCRGLSSSIGDRFAAAQSKLNTLTEDPGNAAKLKIYGLFKQANTGPCNIPKPGGFNFVAKAKYDAWKSLGDMSPDEAKEAYIAFVDELAGPDVPVTDDEELSGLDVSTSGGVTTIKFNRPEKFNALSLPMYRGISKSLRAAAADKLCQIVVLTGEGKFYSAGNDLSSFSENMPPGGLAEISQIGKEICEELIKFPKPLIAAVNGPAIGIPVTTLGLCDLVYCTDNATFKTPFVSLGQSPEGCSSYMFPRIMGFAKANEMLLTERQITAQEACEVGLVTRVFPLDTFRDEVDKVVQHMATLPPQSMAISKSLIRHEQINKLLEVNARECKTLHERWLSEECMTAVMNFLSQKKK